MKKRIVSLISLGCEKNLVDSESILGLFNNDNYLISSDYIDADLVIINTCGFIASAKEEAINTIYEVLDNKKEDTKVIVCGCLVERYYEDLKNGIPEVDLFIPLREYFHFGEYVGALFNDSNLTNLCPTSLKRVISTPKHLAYVRISDGCNNRCAYCAIPLIRGNFRSRNKEEILEEIKYLAKTKRKEICLISQDLTKYGIDINESLESLIKEIIGLKLDIKVRLLYLYPDEISDELISLIRDNEMILPYFDIPIQHASNKLLKWMNRRGDQELIRTLINKIRQEIPDAIIRTTIIVGFPHESEKDHQELMDFIKEMKFDHLGAFTYSKEEDTKSFNMSGQVSKKVKEERYNELMETQKWISLKNNERYIGHIYKTIIEEYDEKEDCYYGRNYMFAPDDIDGMIIIKSSKKLEISEFYDVKIVDNDFYDLYGEVVDERL
ncbi:MAG: 30S ribosomal protein S12 methylthiotransferase RimO [Bacilli bacterium]|nr:30S ribosomal protein S12 methylthiotransferase RimO [Bacilli bacterium]